jgi:hypothetical protein
MKILYIVFITIFLCACQETPKQDVNIGYIFSIKNFMRDLASSQPQLNNNFKKTVISGGKSETRTFRTLDWDKEYVPFTQSDLQKPSWINYITKDSLDNEVTYTTHKNAIPVKKMKIVYADSQLQSLKIWKNTSSLFLSTHTEMYADINGNSKIVQRQKLLFFKPKTLTIIIHPVKK